MASPKKSPGAISIMRLAELRELAEEMQLNPSPKARRTDLIAMIREARDAAKAGGSEAKGPGRPPKAKAREGKDESSRNDSRQDNREDQRSERGGESRGDDSADTGQRRRRSRRVERPVGSTETRVVSSTDTEDEPDEPRSVKDLERALDDLSEKRHRGSDDQADNDHRSQRSQRGDRSQRRDRDEEDDDRRSRNRNRRNRRDRDDDSQRSKYSNRDDRSDRNDRSDRDDRDDRGGRNDRNGRRNRRERDDERDNDSGFDPTNFLPVSGLVDMRDNRVFLRTSGYLPGKSDVMIPQNIVRATGVRHGDAVTGYIRPPREDNYHRGGNRRGRHTPNLAQMVNLEKINGMEVEVAKRRPEFNKLTPLYPQEMLRLETTGKAITPRVIDLVSPVGKGQRGLIVAPPKAGKTIIIQQIATSIAQNYPDVHLMVVLVDERPEEVTDMQRIVRGEVIASTFDRPASDHTIVAELAIERAKRLVELGQDVVVLLDSITRLSRAYNLAAPASGRILSGGVDASALYPPKKFFGAARNIENGGSLTIIASALVETGSKMDEVIFEEFKGTGNMELRLSRALADKRIFPAVDVNASGTRREELLMSPEELKVIWKLRRVMGSLDFQRASDIILNRVKDTGSNAEFLMSIAKSSIHIEDDGDSGAIQ